MEAEKKQSFLKHKYFKFGFWSLTLVGFIIWTGNFWLLLLAPIMFDFYVSKKVNWTFWKKRNQEKKSALVEWVDAIIFAVIAATIIRIFFIEAYTIPTSSMEKDLLVGDYLFVSKFNYGPKMPNTPIAFPFVHHTMPTTAHTPSFIEWPSWKYHRLAGFQEVKNLDVVVFNFPAGDTVVANMQAASYYSIARGRARALYNANGSKGKMSDYIAIAKNEIKKNNEILVRPVDKRENYIKRCIGIHGDSLQVIDGVVFVNGKTQRDLKNMQYKYAIKTSGTIRKKRLQQLGISNEDLDAAMRSREPDGSLVLPLTAKNVDILKLNKKILSVKRIIAPAGERAPEIFPHHKNYNWNVDNFGPIYIPEKGKTVKLTTENLPLYHRVIETYEANKLEVRGNEILINGKVSTEYTFKMDYYFMMGDSRHNSADSRYWGFVPEDHVVGKALFIWFSTDKDASLFSGGIRWNRIFNTIK